MSSQPPPQSNRLRNQKRRDMHVAAHDAGRHADRLRSCCPKCRRAGQRRGRNLIRGRCLNNIAYRTEQEADRARLAAVAAGKTDGGGEDRVYRCDLCDWAHWGRPSETLRELPPAVLEVYRAIVKPLRTRPGEVPRARRAVSPPFHRAVTHTSRTSQNPKDES